MAEMRTIEIDFEVHQKIEAARRSFSEPPNNALRRLLDLGEPSAAETPAPSDNGSAWIGKGVKLPAGTELRMEYRGREHRGVIQNAAWVVDGQTFKSPSAAAGGVARTKENTRPSLDGWKYWYVKLPGSFEWTALGALRQKTGQA